MAVFEDRRRARLLELIQELDGFLYDLDDVLDETSGPVAESLMAARQQVVAARQRLREVLEATV